MSVKDPDARSEYLGIARRGAGRAAISESNRPVIQYFSATRRVLRDDEGDYDPARSAFIDELLAKRRRAAEERG
jgi:hypothetical protein